MLIADLLRLNIHPLPKTARGNGSEVSFGDYVGRNRDLVATRPGN
jgi:hypothetical protein